MLKESHEKFEYLWDGNSKLRKRLKKAFGYMVGGDYQWDPELKAELNSERRATLALNIIAPKINLLYGLERQNRSGWKGIGVGGEDDVVAMLITAILKYEDRNRRLQSVFSRVFKDGNTGGVGWVDVGTVQGKDFLTENRVRRESPFCVLLDHRGKELDQSDWECMARQKWYTVPKLRSMFPEPMKNLKTVEDILDYTLPEEFHTEGTDRSERGGDYGTEDNISEILYVDKVKKLARAVELWTREYDDIAYMVDSNGGWTRIGKDKEQIETAKRRVAVTNEFYSQKGIDLRYKVRTKNEPVIYHEIYSGEVLLSKKAPLPFNHNQFPLVPYFAYNEEIDGKIEIYGIIKNMIDPQDEKNKRRSMTVDILSRAPKGGGFFKRGKKNAAVVKKLAEIGGWHQVDHPEDFVPLDGKYIPVINHVADIEDRGDRDSEEISGINKSMMGFMQGAKESGVLARQRIMQGTLGVQELFEHLDMTKQRVLRMVLENDRQFWTTDKVLRIVGQIPGFEINEQVAAAAVLFSQNDLLDYDVLLDDGENSPTARAYNFASMIEAIQYGITLPPRAVVENSPWSNKQYILEQMDQMQQEQAMMEMIQKGKQGDK